jgi:hypothetical protein
VRRLDQIGLEAAVGRPAQVHAQEHLRPVLRVGASSRGLERDNRVAGVVVAREQGVFLHPLELPLQRVDSFLDVVEIAVVRSQL